MRNIKAFLPATETTALCFKSMPYNMWIGLLNSYPCCCFCDVIILLMRVKCDNTWNISALCLARSSHSMNRFSDFECSPWPDTQIHAPFSKSWRRELSHKCPAAPRCLFSTTFLVTPTLMCTGPILMQWWSYSQCIAWVSTRHLCHRQFHLDAMPMGRKGRISWRNVR
jgi:hypothetical protein